MAEAEAFLKAHNIPLNPGAQQAGSLPFAYRQMTEISKALIGRVRVLVLDEPTSGADWVTRSRSFSTRLGRSSRRGSASFM